VTTISKNQKPAYKIFNCKIVNAISTEVSSQKSDEVSGSKGRKRKFHDVFRLLLRKTRLSHLNVFYSNNFGFDRNIWACLSANITLHN
jgi:hypothetical protein